MQSVLSDPNEVLEDFDNEDFFAVPLPECTVCTLCGRDVCDCDTLAVERELS